MKPHPKRGNRRKGSPLVAAMLFALMVTIAGASLLSMSQITRMGFVRNSEDVRLLIAAEAALESKRGVFVLVPGVQNDWSALLPSSGWNNIGGELTINNIRVQVQGQPIGFSGTLQARLRATAHGRVRKRIIEYVIQAANFADYALYFGSTDTVTIGDNFKMVGNYYSRGSIDLLNNPGIEFFSRVETSGRVMNAPSKVYNFKRGYLEYVAPVQFPPSAYGMDQMRAVAADSSMLFYANTLSIELMGQQFRRTYEYRTKGTGNTYTANQYQVRTQVLNIPDNGVIYVDSARAPTAVDTFSSSTNSTNRALNTTLDLWGVLDYKRVTLACEHDIRVTKNVSYQALLNNPNLRRFTQKDTGAAQAFREMLGVLSATDVIFETTLWTTLPAASRVTNNGALVPPDTGHLTSQFSLDGTFMGVNSSQRGTAGSGTGRELWVCGGIVNGSYSTTALSSNFDRRNYDTDYRLRLNTPPYFLRAFGATPTFVAGSWRTFEQ